MEPPRRKFNTCPARLRKRDVPAMWDLFDNPRATDKSETDDDESSSISRRASFSSIASDASELTVEAGGSWPRMRKQRTGESSSMSLFEVAEALAEHPPNAEPEADVEVEAATAELSSLAALVSAEESAAAISESSNPNVSVESFVEAVFRGIPQPVRSASRPTAASPAPAPPAAHAAPHGLKPAKQARAPTANDLALLEAIAADEAVAAKQAAKRAAAAGAMAANAKAAAAAAARLASDEPMSYGPTITSDELNQMLQMELHEAPGMHPDNLAAEQLGTEPFAALDADGFYCGMAPEDEAMMLYERFGDAAPPEANDESEGAPHYAHYDPVNYDPNGQYDPTAPYAGYMGAYDYEDGFDDPDRLARRLEHAMGVPLDSMPTLTPEELPAHGLASAGYYAPPLAAAQMPEFPSNALYGGAQPELPLPAPPSHLPHPAAPHAGAGGAERKPARNGAERREWSSSEDAIIQEAVQTHGCRWRKIAALLPGRSDDAVRNRWNRLREMDGGNTSPKEESGEGSASGEATLPTGGVSARRSASEGGAPREKPERISWSKAEDETILRSVSELGHKWNKIAERLPGRTDHAIRNRFHRLQSLLEDRQRQQQRVLAPSVPLHTDALLHGISTMSSANPLATKQTEAGLGASGKAELKLADGKSAFAIDGLPSSHENGFDTPVGGSGTALTPGSR